MTDLAVEARGLAKRFGATVALAGIDLAVPRGAFYGFLGTNGAGKTTAVHCLTGLLRPSAGEVRLLGEDLARRSVQLKLRIGVVPERLNLFDRLTLGEFLEYAGALYGLKRDEARRRAADLAAVLDLGGVGDGLLAHFSKGMQRKAALAAALIHGPELLFLDEPFEGVDVASAEVIQGLLTGLVQGGATVFLTSHVMDVVARLCRRVAFLDRGVLLAEGELSELLAPLEREHPGESRPRLLERLFLRATGKVDAPARTLSWLKIA